MMSNELYVVVNDTALNIGAVIGYAEAAVVRARGGTVLPYDKQPTGAQEVPMSGYSVRHFGAGHSLETQTPQVQTSVGIYLPPGNWSLHWATRIQGSDTVIQMGPNGCKEKCSGSIVLAADQRGAGAVNFAPVAKVQPLDFRQFLPMDVRGGWLLGGKGEVAAQRPGYHQFALFGCMRVLAPNTGPSPMHMFVPWMAVSVTRLG
jgi:hypothetical protein